MSGGDKIYSESDDSPQVSFKKHRKPKIIISSDEEPEDEGSVHSRGKSHNEDEQREESNPDSLNSESDDSFHGFKKHRKPKNIISSDEESEDERSFHSRGKSHNEDEQREESIPDSLNSESDDSLHASFKKPRKPKNIILSDNESDEDKESVHSHGKSLNELEQKVSLIEDSFEETELQREKSGPKNDHDYHKSIDDSLSEEGDIETGFNITKADILGEIDDISDDEDIINSSGEISEENGLSYAEISANEFPVVSSTRYDDDSEVEAIAESQPVIEVSSEDEGPSVSTNTQLQQKVLQNISNQSQPTSTKSIVQNVQRNVNRPEYEEQVAKVAKTEQELMRIRNTKRIINVATLPDKGKSLISKEQLLEEELLQQKTLLSQMVVKEAPDSNKIQIKWDEIEAGVNAVAPRTLGKQGVARFNAEKNLAVETLDELHKSLATCPTENDFVDDPRGLKVPLMVHQRRALAWLLWRETQKPCGGILADDMGLGKTLTMISLIIKSLQLESNADDREDKENYRDKYQGGTLVVCPASLLNQWSGEVESKTKRGLLSVEVHHGPRRETKAKRLAKLDMVITTYAIVLSESERDSTLFGVRWRRIILDEAHQIRNHKARTSEAVFRLSGKSRWSLTGTPVHNKELDMFSQLKFLRCSPFDDLQVWKHWVSDKSTGGQMRLHAVISSLMLRRTKDELMGKGVLKSLPERTWELISVTLDKDETAVYQKMLIFSRTLFAQFLHQRAMKNQDAYDMKFNQAPPDPNGEYFKMRNKLVKLNKVKEVNQHDILVLLLRLRQICCHPSLISQMLNGDEDLGGASEEEHEEINLLEQLNKLTVHDDDDVAHGLNNEAVGLTEASKGYLNPSNPVFMKERPSSKVKALVKLAKEKIKNGDKAIIVSQWTSLLQLVGIQLREARIKYDSLDGSIPVQKRMPIVDNFNDPESEVRVLLLSLTAGGVGLNLVGANHLFLMDLHWNPQLENQAQDRIYRMGQQKPIFVYKLMAVDTIEERIKQLQERKLEIANAMLTGSKKVIDSKLTLQDLKLLFDFK